MVVSRSSSSGAPVRANLRRRRSAILMLRMPSSTLPSRSLNSRLVPHLHGAEVAVLLLADADAFGIVALGAERRGAGGADPLAAALVPALLLLQPLAQRLHELVPAHRLDLLLLFLGEVFFRELLQPFGGNVRLLHGVEQALQPLEHGAEHAVELVEIALVLHQRGARQIIEILHRLVGEVGVERLHQRQIFAQGHRDLRVAQRCEELQEHSASCVRLPAVRCSVNLSRAVAQKALSGRGLGRCPVFQLD